MQGCDKINWFICNEMVTHLRKDNHMILIVKQMVNNAQQKNAILYNKTSSLLFNNICCHLLNTKFVHRKATNIINITLR